MEKTAQNHSYNLSLPRRCGAAVAIGIERVAESADDVVDGVRRSVGKVDDELPELVEAEPAVAVLVQRPHDDCGQRVWRNFKFFLCKIVVQGWGKKWSLGCVNSRHAARGSQEVGFTQPRDNSLAQPCINM